MLETEYVRSLQSNYERIHLAEQPDEHRYQYCILTRGGIRGLLPCSLRYINGESYLYYDITSRQSMAQLFARKKITKDWVKSFFWNYEHMGMELGRFLLDEKNLMVYPEHVFQDLDHQKFFFLYLPYEESGNGMDVWFEFLLAHMDYDDEVLVECIYNMYEQFENMGGAYLQQKIFEDAKVLDQSQESLSEQSFQPKRENAEDEKEEKTKAEYKVGEREELVKTEIREIPEEKEKRGILGRFGGRKKKDDESLQGCKGNHSGNRTENQIEDRIGQMQGQRVAEDPDYEGEYGQTVYMEYAEPESASHRLYSADGRILGTIGKGGTIIGKQKEGVDLIVEDESVSRMHACIRMENDRFILEDLNSTNGTFKNGLRLQPYEKRRLEPGDEIQLGKLLMVFR